MGSCASSGPRGCGAHTDEVRERDHELRAALRGIEAVAVVLSGQRDHLPSAQVDELAKAIAEEARRLRSLLDPRVKQRAAFDLADAILPAILMARSCGVEVRYAVPAGVLVGGDRDAVAQVVWTLLDNVRAHAASSTADVWVEAGREACTLHVEDRGHGINDTLAQQVFERGVRSADSSGSGLGLFIAQRLMMEHGGSLEVHRRPGGGSSFRLTCPSAHSTSSPARPQSELAS